MAKRGNKIKFVHKVVDRRVTLSSNVSVKCETSRVPADNNGTSNRLVKRAVGVLHKHIDTNIKRIKIALEHSSQVRIVIDPFPTGIVLRVKSVSHDNPVGVFRRGRVKDGLVTLNAIRIIVKNEFLIGLATHSMTFVKMCNVNGGLGNSEAVK